MNAAGGMSVFYSWRNRRNSDANQTKEWRMIIQISDCRNFFASVQGDLLFAEIDGDD